MANQVKSIPEGYHTLTPYLHVRGAAQAIDFYKKAFGAEELFRIPGPDGKTVGHAELKIGNSIIMLADENPAWGILSPESLKGTPISFLLYVEDVDAAFQRAVDAGGKVERPIEDKFYGDRSGTIADPYGHQWSLATHKEDVSPEEMNRRVAAEYAKMDAQPKS